MSTLFIAKPLRSCDWSFKKKPLFHLKSSERIMPSRHGVAKNRLLVAVRAFPFQSKTCTLDQSICVPSLVHRERNGRPGWPSFSCFSVLRGGFSLGRIFQQVLKLRTTFWGLSH